MSNEQRDWVAADFEVDLSVLTIGDLVALMTMTSNPAMIGNVLPVLDKCIKGGISHLPADAFQAAFDAFGLALQAKYPNQTKQKRESRILGDLFKGMKL